jgi:hypothetical protein
MRIEILSEHPDDMLAEAVRKRERGALEQLSRAQAVRQERDRARSEGRWLAWLRLAFAVSRAKREARRHGPPAALPTGREEALRAGRDAERQVAGQLARALDDKWILFRGYLNGSGEIDGLLLGPRGLFAIEVKHRNATVYIRGDEWLAQRFDNYGNSRSGRVPMRDAAGRSPSEQLNQPVSALARWLRKNKRETPITPVVLLTHDNARVAPMESPTVRVMRSVRALLALIERSPGTLDTRKQADIEKLIRRDHHFHEARRPIR